MDIPPVPTPTPTPAPTQQPVTLLPPSPGPPAPTALFEPPQEDFDFASQGPTVSVESVLHTWGGVYMGHWRCDQPHGLGILELRNGQVHTCCICTLCTWSAVRLQYLRRNRLKEEHACCRIVSLFIVCLWCLFSLSLFLCLICLHVASFFVLFRYFKASLRTGKYFPARRCWRAEWACYVVASKDRCSLLFNLNMWNTCAYPGYKSGASNTQWCFFYGLFICIYTNNYNNFADS